METIEARIFLIKLMGDERVYDSYIETQLAGDFAVKLQQRFEKQYNPPDSEGCIHCDSGEELPPAFNYCPYCSKRLPDNDEVKCSCGFRGRIEELLIDDEEHRRFFCPRCRLIGGLEFITNSEKRR